ncbi:unnamed protein product, partial [Ectocarpus sp. 12 AP-2014]
MAELGDFLTGGSEKLKDVTIEMLDYDFLDKCTDPDLIRAIARKLKSGEEGHYPDLVKHAETRLLEELPQAERSKILRMKAEPQPDEIHEAISDLHGWEDEMARLVPARPKESNSEEAHAGSTKTIEPPMLDARRGNDDGGLARSTGLAIEQNRTKKLNAYDFRAWERYDADKEVERLEKEELEEQRRKAEARVEAKVTVEQDRLRRATKRDNQLREAGKARYQGNLSPFEKRRAAERERIKGNESFKVR